MCESEGLGVGPLDNLDEVLLENLVYWDVEEDGTIRRSNMPSYVIEADRLLEQNWLTHIFKKDIDAEERVEFYFAYLKALSFLGETELTICIND